MGGGMMTLKREIKISAQKVNSSLEQEDSPESYRNGMLVNEVMVFETWFGKTGYYVCPCCKITLDREFISFCDRCGQKLDWRYYRKAKIVYPGQCCKQRARQRLLSKFKKLLSVVKL